VPEYASRPARDRNLPAVWGKLTLLLTALAMVATACARGEISVQPAELDENTFVINVADFEGDVGRGLSLTTDAEGNPHMSYLAFEDPQEPGATPAPALPGAPVLPAVKHAHVVGGAWTRTMVAEGVQADPSADATAIAVDAAGVHHIVWTEGGNLRYSNNAEGSFSEPATIAEGTGASGPSITVGADSVPLVAFYEQAGGGGADVETPLVRAAIATPGGWEVETAAEASPGEPASTAIGLAGDTPVVAYGSEGRTLLARRSADIWESEEADADGGLGVSMSIDADGNPHLAYYNGSGQVRHAHSIGGGPWEPSVVGPTDLASGDDVAAGPSIVVDAEGVHHVAWEDAEAISYANNESGEFVAEQVPGSQTEPAGRIPGVGLSAEGVLYLAWYDPEDTEVQLAVRGGGEPLLAVPPPAPTTAQPTGEPTGPPPCEPDGTELTLTAPPGALSAGFAEDCLAAPAGEPITVTLANQDSAPHNLGIYTSQGGDRLFTPPTLTNPGESVTYEVEPIPDPGQYFFQCDLHPTTMTGTFVVA
jgi:plastocyanin